MASSTVMIYLVDNKFEVDLTDGQYYWLALSLFIYQTLDAIDGKHARNTKRSSPLGMLMDHGCDSLTNSFALIQVFQAFKFKGEYILVILQSLTQVSIIPKLDFFLYSNMGRKLYSYYENSIWRFWNY